MPRLGGTLVLPVGWTKCTLEIVDYMSRIVRKADCLCKNKGADQLPSNCEADQRLCFRYTVSLLLKFEISSS